MMQFCKICYILNILEMRGKNLTRPQSYNNWQSSACVRCGDKYPKILKIASVWKGE